MENIRRQEQRYLSRVTAILSLAESKKITDRKKFVQNLQDIYDNNEITKAIDKQSAADLKSETSWNEIMLTVHKAAVSEAERLINKAATGSSRIAQHSYSALMHKTVKLATGTMHISLSCNDLMACIFEVLGNKTYKAYHETYVDILATYVLTNKMYSLKITAEQWREVLKMTIKLYRGGSDTAKRILLDTVRLIVQIGCTQSHLVLNVKKMFAFLEKLFQEIDADKEAILKSLYKLVCAVCQHIGTESRIALCEFNERCLPAVLSLEKCPEKTNMLLLLMQIYDRGDAGLDDDVTYVPAAWKSIVAGIHTNVVRDVKTDNLSPCFWELCCEVYRQILQDPSIITEESSSSSDKSDEQPRKRRRLSTPVRTATDLLLDSDLGVAGSVRILTVLLRKYPKTMRASDYPAFLKILSERVAASIKNPTLMDSLCELCTVVLKIEKEQFYEVEQAQSVRSCWEKICDVVLRTLSANQNEVLGHELLRSIIECKNVLDTNEFLLVYLRSQMRWSPSSVQTLLTFCSYVPIPDRLSPPKGSAAKPNTSIRESLLQWALNVPSPKSSTEIPAIPLANLLTALAMKFRHRQEHREFQSRCDRADREKIVAVEDLVRDLFDDRESKALSDIGRCRLALQFRHDRPEIIEESPKIEPKMSTVFEADVFDSLVMRLSETLASAVTDKNVGSLVTKVTVAAKLMSNFLELDDKFESLTAILFDAFCETYKNILSHLMTKEDSTCLYLVRAFETLEIFYRARYHRKVARNIVDLTPQDFIAHVYNFVPEDEEDLENDENYRTINVRDLRAKTNTCRPTDACRTRNAAHNILACFCSAPIGEKISALQTKVSKNLLNIKIYESASTGNLRRILIALKAFGESGQCSTDVEPLKTTIVFLNELLKAWRRDETAVRGMLKVLPHFVKSALLLFSGADSLLRILSEIYASLLKERYGPLVHADFVKCLVELIRLNPLLKWKIVGASEESFVIEILPSYVTSPFYLVRLKVVRALGELFASKDLEAAWKCKFFDKIVSAIGDLFVVEELSDDLERADELATRTATAFQILAAIIRSSEFLRARALYAMIELSVRKDVRASVMKSALRSVVKNEAARIRLLEDNLGDLLSRWFRAEYPIDQFPWRLISCDTQQEFLARHIDVLLAIKLWRLEFQDFQNLCDNVGLSFPRTIERCFPSLISLLTATIVRANTGRQAELYAREMFERLRSNAGEFAEVEKFCVLLHRKLPEIVVSMVESLSDREHLYMMLDVNVVLPNVESPTFNAETIDRCLRRLQEELRLEKCSLVEYFVTQRPSALQRILLELYCRVCDAGTTENQVLAFHQYAYFYTAVLQEISLPCFDPMSQYVARDLVYSLLALMEEKPALSEMACSYFLIFLRTALPARSNEIEAILSFAVSRLVRIIQTGKLKSAMNVLRYLVIDHSATLAAAFERLDSFPNDAIFDAVKQVHDGLKYSAHGSYTLEGEIEHFLNATRDKTRGCRLEGLLHVQNELSTRKLELSKLYSKLGRSHDFREDSASNSLHELVYRLVQLTRSSQQDISLAAAQCLGELNPADLTSMNLHAERGYCKEDNGEVETLTFKAISLLAGYLVENDTNLRRASAKALSAIFSTSWGAMFVDRSTLNAFASICKVDIPNLHDYIYPFGTKTRAKSLPIRIDEKNWEIFANRSNDLWVPSDCDSYAQWIVEITSRCLDCFVNLYAEVLKSVCRLSVEFCEMLLPRLLNLATKTQESLVNDVCACVNRFFAYLFELICSATTTNVPRKREVASSYECIRCMLDVVNFMRIQRTEHTLLDLRYLLVAKAAQYCSAHFTSVLYAELWCESVLRDTDLMQKKQPGTWTSVIDCICEFNPTNGKLLQEILREAYVRVGDPDCIYGCGLSYLVHSAFKTQYYVHLKQWNKVTLAYDVALTSGRNATHGMLTALQQSSHRYLLKCLIDKVNKKTEHVDEFMYDVAWRLADWSILEPHEMTDSVPTAVPQSCSKFGYQSAHYRALLALRDDDAFSLDKALENARASIVQSLRDTSIECSQTLYPLLSQLQMLREIEKFATKNSENYIDLISEWNQEHSNESHDFQYVEPILAQRLIMYQTRNFGRSATTLELAATSTNFKIAELAQAQGYLPIAHRVLSTLAKRVNLPDAARNHLTYQKALLDWREKDRYMGRLALRNLLKRPCVNDHLRAKALRVYGNWMAETASESSQIIINEYYNKSVALNSNIGDSESLMDSLADLAQFADAQYRQIVDFTKTAQYESLVECDKFKDEQPISKTLANQNIDQRKAMLTYRRQVDYDAKELIKINADMKTYLLLAVRNYLKALATGNDYDLLVYRMISLWLDNMLHEHLNANIGNLLPSVPSYKFVAVLPQLATHMSNVATSFVLNINNFVERCAEDHPHHTLPILFALQNAYKDDEFGQSTMGTQKHSRPRSEPRIVAASQLISKLAKSEARPIIQEMYQLSHALMSLAYYKVPGAEASKLGGAYKIPRSEALFKIRDFHHAMVPTVTLDVRSNCKYGSVVGVSMYEETFELLGGLGGPKKITCVDSSGIRRRQLLKSQYDLRRDAVLQQVCTAANLMLKATKETKRRKLRIRTYKTVPLSQRSGVLEWCHNAQPISQILCDTETRPGIHSKYYPNDWSVEKCRTKLREVHKAPFSAKRETFLQCCRNLHPAFHHYFTEKYPSAEAWFAKRLAYVRSVATTSMIGYMLGLGDRSCKNILIDGNTAEVIHTDFGISFAEGKVSSTPETVPFRLTRDIEAAMGICGVEGVMKRSCEQTVTVLRENRKALMTLLQVLLYDPLFMWTLVPANESESQSTSRRSRRASTAERVTNEATTNKVAERALLKIEQNLEGMEDGLPSSVSGQVERLIQEARDPDKLCRMFYDWQPYL